MDWSLKERAVEAEYLEIVRTYHVNIRKRILSNRVAAKWKMKMKNFLENIHFYENCVIIYLYIVSYVVLDNGLLFESIDLNMQWLKDETYIILLLCMVGR